MRILAISGSLRSASTNTALVRVLSAAAPEGVEIDVYDRLSDLPQFNPDREEGDAVVADLRERLRASDGLLISSPEYAHGVPGSLKNALDWVVGTGELVGKSIALVNASPAGGTFAQAQLTETLTVMSAIVVPEASVRVPVLRQKVGNDGRISDPEIIAALRPVLEALLAAVRAARTDPGRVD